jgi:hypothetical protein
MRTPNRAAFGTNLAEQLQSFRLQLGLYGAAGEVGCRVTGFDLITFQWVYACLRPLLQKSCRC